VPLDPRGVRQLQAMNIFDPRTFAYLGMTTRGEQGQLGGDALVLTAIVDRAGEMP
jgi:hypothetical protein